MKATYSRRSAVRLMALIGAICIFASLAATTVAATTSGPAPAQVAPPTPPQAPTVPLQHNIIIQSTDGLQIAPRERKEWYQEGTWPLIGSIAAVLITNTLAIALVYLQSRRSFNALLRQCKIELLSSSLNDFYNPLLALIEINGEIFAKTGPRSFPEAHYEREAAALVWKQMKTKILENNHELEIILRTKTHLTRIMHGGCRSCAIN